MSGSDSPRSTFSMVVVVVQWVVGVAAAAFVVMLFALGDRGPSPDSSEYASSGPYSDDAPAGPDGREIYSRRCASCHGPGGEGVTGPALTDIAEKYPDVAVQEALVAGGRNSMPAFAARISPAEITAVVEFTRTEFASG